MYFIDRSTYATLYGPTVGDRVRLADTDLIIEVERDMTSYGEEVRFGGAIQDSMGQSQITYKRGAVDTVITNALIVDYWGIIKADIGIKDGRIDTIGKAGNPDIQPRVDIIIGPGTEVISGEGRLITAGAVVATQTRFITQRRMWEALYAGVTTVLGGGTGPAEGTRTTACTPGPWYISRMLQAAEALPINIGIFGKGNSSKPDALREQVMAGACGLVIHPSWGMTPSVVDTCLALAELVDIQVNLYATSTEYSSLTEIFSTFKGRTLHVLHPDGQTDSLRLCAEPNVLLSLAPNAVPSIAESILHDIGAFAMIAPSHGTVGRVENSVISAWQISHRMKARYGPLQGETGENDNLRVRRTIAKYTINPAVSHGIAQHVGSIEIGKIADLVLWQPRFFGVKPDLVLKGGMIASALVGDGDTTAQPIQASSSFGTCGRANVLNAITFVSRQAIEESVAKTLNLQKPLVSVWGTRTVAKKDMLLNNTTPWIELNPHDTTTIYINGQPIPTGQELTREALPLAQRYFLF